MIFSPTACKLCFEIAFLTNGNLISSSFQPYFNQKYTKTDQVCNNSFDSKYEIPAGALCLRFCWTFLYRLGIGFLVGPSCTRMGKRPAFFVLRYQEFELDLFCLNQSPHAWIVNAINYSQNPVLRVIETCSKTYYPVQEIERKGQAMSIESDVSAIKRDVQQLSRTSSDLKRDIQKMKDEVSNIKDASPGPFLKVVKGAALLAAINKIDGLSDKVDTLTETAYAKYKEAKAARMAEEQRLALAKEQDRRLKEEHDTKMAFERMQNERLQREHFEKIETERLEKQQRNNIINLWTEYQRIKQEPNILNQFFLIQIFCEKSKNISASCVKDSEALNHFSELATCKETLLNIIKERKGEEYFFSLQEAIGIQKELHRLAHSFDYNSSYVAACKGCIKTIEHIKTIIPEYHFSVEEQHTIFQRIQDYQQNSALMASFYNAFYNENLVTENIILLLQTIAKDYRLDSRDIPEIFRSKPDIVLQTNDWCLFWERLVSKSQQMYSEDVQKFYDFVADRAGKARFDLQYQTLIATLKQILPQIVIADETPYELGNLDQKIIGYYQYKENQFVVFLEHSFFWFDSQKNYLIKSKYDTLQSCFPPDIRHILESIIPAIHGLGFVISKELNLSEELKPLEENYNTYLIEEAEQQKQNQKLRSMIADICSKYASQKMHPDFLVTNDEINEIIAESANKELVILVNGFRLKMYGASKMFDFYSWEKFSHERLRLSLSSFQKAVLFDGKKTAVYSDGRYYCLLQEIVNTLYPLEDNEKSDPLPAEPRRSSASGCVSFFGYVISSIWLMLVIAVFLSMFFDKESPKNLNYFFQLSFGLAILSIPSLIGYFISYKMSHKNKRGE